MPIIASLISRGNVVLAEYCPPGNNFPQIARKLIEQIPSVPDSKKSYSYESFNFNYIAEGGLTYICMSDQEMGLRVPYAFLFDINNRFKATFREKLLTAGHMAMNDTFSRVLRDRLEFFSNDKNADKINKVKGEIEDAKQIMVKNIDKVLERGERIEMLVSKTDDLHTQSQSFKKKSTQLKRKMCCQNAKLCFVIICVVSVIVLGILAIILWKLGVFNLAHNNSNGDSSTTGSTTGTTANSTNSNNLLKFAGLLP